LICLAAKIDGSSRLKTMIVGRGGPDLPPDVAMISNEPEAVLLYLNRYPRDLDEWAALQDAEAGALSFGCGGSALERLFRQPGARLILLSPAGWIGIAEERNERAALTQEALCGAVSASAGPSDP